MNSPFISSSHSSLIESYFDSESSTLIIVTDANFKISYCNKAVSRLFGINDRPIGEVINTKATPNLDKLNVDSDQPYFGLLKFSANGMESQLKVQINYEHNQYLIFAELLMLSEQATLEKMTTIQNELINLNREMSRKNREIEEAYLHIRQLKELIPICSFCHQVRNDEGFWNNLEKYIMDNTDSQFSHSVCPECAEKHYGIKVTTDT